MTPDDIWHRELICTHAYWWLERRCVARKDVNGWFEIRGGICPSSGDVGEDENHGQHANKYNGGKDLTRLKERDARNCHDGARYVSPMMHPQFKRSGLQFSGTHYRCPNHRLMKYVAPTESAIDWHPKITWLSWSLREKVGVGFLCRESITASKRSFHLWHELNRQHDL